MQQTTDDPHFTDEETEPRHVKWSASQITLSEGRAAFRTLPGSSPPPHLFPRDGLQGLEGGRKGWGWGQALSHSTNLLRAPARLDLALSTQNGDRMAEVPRSRNPQPSEGDRPITRL